MSAARPQMKSTSGPEGVYAHSLNGKPVDRWEPLSHHLAAVGTRAATFAAPFGCTETARVSGHLHDIGKLAPEFQAYIRGERATGGDHSSAGARVAYDAYPYPLSKILAAIIAAHHAGLADGTDLDRRMEAARDIIPAQWEMHSGPLPVDTGTSFQARQKKQGLLVEFSLSDAVLVSRRCGFSRNGALLR